jgi:hypothetical protein
MTNLPNPLVKKDVDLQKYSWIKLDIMKLQNSETWRLAAKVPFAGFACINLWMAAWHQVPAGSIPLDKDWIKKKADVPDDTWKKVGPIAMRNFIRCSDGRLYHKVLCRMVNEVWGNKKTNYARTKKAREKLKEIREGGGHGGGRTRNVVNDCHSPSPSNLKPIPDNSKATATDSALLQSPIEKEREIEKEKRDYRLSRAPARGDGGSAAEKIVKEFLRLRTVHWPYDCNLPAPTMTLEQVAKEWVSDGVPVELATTVMERVMVKNARDGKKNAPTNLKFCSFSIENANIEYKKLGKLPEGQSNPAADRDPVREDLMFTLAGLLSRADFAGVPFDTLTNDQITSMIEEKQNDPN